MANRDELKQKRGTDARVALLGLVADKQGSPQRGCLSSSEMAELLDEKCVVVGQRQQYLAHLSTCEACYREWVDLQQELSHGSVDKKKPLLFQRKFLTVSGSLLAAAASVVFYLNLDISPGPEEQSVLIEPQFERKDSPEKLEIRKQQKSVESIVKPASVEQSKPQLDEVQMESVQDSMAKEVVVPLKEAQLRTKRMAASVMVLDPVQLWIQQVHKKCAAKNSDPADWQDLVRQGKELSSKGTFPQLEIILEKIIQLNAGDAREAVCAEIQRIVREKNHEQ